MTPITPEHIALLLIRLAQGALPENEEQELSAWIELSDTNRAIAAKFSETGQLKENLLDVLSKHAVWERIRGVMEENRPVQRKRYWLRWTAAAAVILMLVTGAYLFNNQKNTSAPPVAKVPDVMPGTSKAMLTLADGSVITLDSAGHQVIRQGSISIHQQGGQLQYMGNSHTISYNTLTTPNGGQFLITLPDGSKVWLNAASSIHYPTAFNGKERRVSITGEAYFEVSANAQQPFYVSVNNTKDIEVLGTSFNINAYANEVSVNTTLLQGAVRIGSVVLHPGQQARVTGQEIKVIKEIDTEQAIAWKNGLFNFEGASLEEVMHQLERWYDIEVTYDKYIPRIVFGGEMGRDLTLQSVISMLEGAGVNFRLEGRKLIVLQ